jgi:hypothetical protein
MLIKVQRNLCMFMHSRSQGNEKSMRPWYRGTMCPGLSHRKRNWIMLSVATRQRKK